MCDRVVVVVPSAAVVLLQVGETGPLVHLVRAGVEDVSEVPRRSPGRASAQPLLLCLWGVILVFFLCRLKISVSFRLWKF